MATNTQSQETLQDVVDVTKSGIYLLKQLSSGFLVMAKGVNKFYESITSAVGGLFNGKSQSLAVGAAINSLPTARSENE